MGSLLAVTFEIGANIGRLKASTLAYSDRHELTAPHEAVDTAARDAENTGNVGNRE
jgi:hypothetical protein